jgi:parallel beta-helix repeat protein
VRKLLFAMLLMASAGFAQTTTTVTGTIKDLTGTTVTSGQVTFNLKPSSDTTISGTARFVPTTATCSITASGVKALDNVSACTITNNTSLTPSGTYYLVCIQPQFASPGSCLNWYALGGTQDITTVVPTPSTLPAYTFLDLSSAQTLTGIKTFTNGFVSNGTSTVSSLNGVTTASTSAPQTSITTGAGGRIFFPTGTYTAASGLTISTDNTLIDCAGWGSIINVTGNPDYGVLISGNNVEVRNCKFTGNSARQISISGNKVYFHDNWVQDGGSIVPAAGALRACIQVEGTSDVIIDHNTITACGGATNPAVAYDIAVNFETSANTSRIRISNNRAFSSDSQISIGTYNLIDSTISGNNVDQNNKIGPDPSASGYGIMVYTQQISPLRASGNRITGNVVNNTAGSGIYINISDSTVIANNKVLNSAQQENRSALPVGGIAVNAGGLFPLSTDMVIANNQIDTIGTLGNGIELANVLRMAITGNTIRNSQRSCILVSVSQNVDIVGNIVNTCVARYGVEVDVSSTNTTVTGNNITNAGSGSYSILDTTAFLTVKGALGTDTLTIGGGSALTTSNFVGSGSLVKATAPAVTGLTTDTIVASGQVSAGTFSEAAGKFTLNSSGVPTTVSNIATAGSIGTSPIVANVTLTAQNAAIAAATIYTPAADGFYRACGHLVIDTAGGAGTISPQMVFSGTAGGAVGRNMGNDVTVTSQNLDNLVSNGMSGNCISFKSKASQPIQYRTVFNTVTVGSLSYSFDVTLERLQ